MEEMEGLVGSVEDGGRDPVEDTSAQSEPSNALHYLRRINRTLDELAAAPAVGFRGGRSS